MAERAQLVRPFRANTRLDVVPVSGDYSLKADLASVSHAIQGWIDHVLHGLNRLTGQRVDAARPPVAQ